MEPITPTAEWTVQETLTRRPEAAAVFIHLRMACVGCVMARFETLAEASAAYYLEVQTLLELIHQAPQAQQRDDGGQGGDDCDPTGEGENLAAR